MSNLGAFYHNCSLVKFIPSFEFKDKEEYTITSRKYAGILNINNVKYLTYRISQDNDKNYILSVIYDMQKEKQYTNFIVLVNDMSRVKLDDFCFGTNQVLIIQDTIENREKLKYMHSISWSKIVPQYYKSTYLSKYNFCDYTNGKDKYISTFYFLDTEKINRIKYFLRENKNKNADIICSKELKEELKKELPNCNYTTINIEEYIDKEKIVYD